MRRVRVSISILAMIMPMRPAAPFPQRKPDVRARHPLEIIFRQPRINPFRRNAILVGITQAEAGRVTPANRPINYFRVETSIKRHCRCHSTVQSPNLSTITGALLGRGLPSFEVKPSRGVPLIRYFTPRPISAPMAYKAGTKNRVTKSANNTPKAKLMPIGISHCA